MGRIGYAFEAYKNGIYHGFEKVQTVTSSDKQLDEYVLSLYMDIYIVYSTCLFSQIEPQISMEIISKILYL